MTSGWLAPFCSNTGSYQHFRKEPAFLKRPIGFGFIKPRGLIKSYAFTPATLCSTMFSNCEHGDHVLSYTTFSYTCPSLCLEKPALQGLLLNICCSNVTLYKFLIHIYVTILKIIWLLSFCFGQNNINSWPTAFYLISFYHITLSFWDNFITL